MPRVNFKKWIFPCLLLLIFITIISYIVTKTHHDKREEIQENLTVPTSVSTKNVSTEKVKLLLPYLRAYLLSDYPTRKSVTSDGDNSTSRIWEDLSGNKNDFNWDTTPKLSKNKGFHTKNNTLKSPDVTFMDFGDTREFTIILRSATIQPKTVETEFVAPTDIGEIIANADLSNKGKTNLMSINVPASIKENFENLKEHLSSGNQTPDTLKTVLVNAGQIKNTLDKEPNKGKKPPQNPPVLVLHGMQSGNTVQSLAVRVPNGVGNLEVSVNSKKTTNIQKVSSPDDTYYVIVYKKAQNLGGGHITAYVNTTLVIDEDVSEIVLDTSKKMVINPSGTLNIGLEGVGVLNRALNSKEIGYFLRSDIVLRTIIDESSTEFINDEGERCEEDCTIRCTKNKCVKECVNKHKKACPKVYKDSYGNYIIKGKNYGSNRRVAREIYRINYPNCENVPEELDEWYNKEVIIENSCPFIVDSQFNPCRFYACENVNWDASNPKRAGMNQKCRKRVDAYCEEHAYLDPMCKCWRSEYYDLPECVAFRAKFNNPRDRGCSAADFPIEENPDFDQYIKKDKIPCWGCSIDELPASEYR